jgi:hypothetical protein
MTLSSYPKVWNLGHPEVSSLFDGPVVLQEKVDGSQFSFGVIDGRLQMRSKGADVYDEAEGGGLAESGKMFRPAVEYIVSVRGRLRTGWVYRAEFFQKPKHNALAYDRVPLNGLVLYDVEASQQNFLGIEQLEAEAQVLDIEAIRTFAETESSAEAIRALLEEASQLGGQKVEGVVIKAYGRYGRDGKTLMGKFVSEAFKEVHRKAWGESNPGNSDVIQRMVDGLRTPARWNKAVIHATEHGLLEHSPRDIGLLIRMVQEDVVDEELPVITKTLLDWALPKVRRGAAGGIAEWYKQRLLDEQFAEPEA